MSMKNSNDTIGNGTRDLPACSAVPQPTAHTACGEWVVENKMKINPGESKAVSFTKARVKE